MLHERLSKPGNVDRGEFLPCYLLMNSSRRFIASPACQVHDTVPVSQDEDADNKAKCGPTCADKFGRCSRPGWSSEEQSQWIHASDLK